MKLKRQQLKKAVLEHIHGFPYEEIIKSVRKDMCVCDGHCICNFDDKSTKGIELTIGLIIYSLNKVIHDSDCFIHVGPGHISFLDVNWKLAEKDGQECTDNQQTDETIEVLLKLFK